MARTVPSRVVAFIDRFFPTARAEDESRKSKNWGLGATDGAMVRALLDLVEEIPDGCLTLEGEDFAVYVAARATVQHAIASWNGIHANFQLGLVPKVDPPLNALSHLRRLLRQCEDDVIPPETAELLFLKDEALRADLRRDLAHAERALFNGEWKSSTVLSGSVLEALLFWGLSQRKYRRRAMGAKGAARDDKGKTRPLDEWQLRHLIAVAEELGLLGTRETITEAKLAQSYRNLIHPTREARLAQRCDKGTAQAAAAAVSHAIADLAAQFR